MSADHIGEATNMVAPVEAVAWRWRIDDAQCPAWEYADTRPGLLSAPHLTIQPLYTHPAPIKPSGDTGELRERVAQIIEAAIERHNPGNSLRHTIDDADAILDLIQSERAGPRVSILSTKFVGDNTNGQPIFEGGADGVTNITLHGWTCFGPDEAGQKALAGFQSERAG